MTRYLPKCVTASLAGLVAVLALASATTPAAAKVKCVGIPQYPYRECHRIVSTLKYQIRIRGRTITITITVGDPPTVTIKILHNGIVVKTFESRFTGRRTFKYRAEKPGKYTIEFMATEGRVTKHRTKHLKIK